MVEAKGRINGAAAKYVEIVGELVIRPKARPNLRVASYDDHALLSMIHGHVAHLSGTQFGLLQHYERVWNQLSGKQFKSQVATIVCMVSISGAYQFVQCTTIKLRKENGNSDTQAINGQEHRDAMRHQLSWLKVETGLHVGAMVLKTQLSWSGTTPSQFRLCCTQRS